MDSGAIDATRQGRLLAASAAYWKCYASGDEARAQDLRAWSPDTMANDIVPRALALVAAHSNGGRQGSANDLELRGSGQYWRMMAKKRLGGIRLSLMGVREPDMGPCQQFLSDVSEAASTDLIMCVVPSSYADAWLSAVSALRRDGVPILSLLPADLNAIAEGRVALLEIVEFKLYRVLSEGRSEQRSQYSELAYAEFRRLMSAGHFTVLSSVAAAIERRMDPPENWVEVAILDSLVQAMTKGENCLIVGQSSTGKSILALHAGLSAGHRNVEARYANVGLLTKEHAAVAFRELLPLFDSKQQTAIILDDLQSNPGVAEYLLRIVGLLARVMEGPRISVVAVCWPSFLATGYGFGGFRRFPIEPSGTKRSLLAKYGGSVTPEVLVELERTAGDDLLLWRLGLEYQSQSVLSRSALSEHILNRMLERYGCNPSEALRVIYVAAMLGRFELAFSDSFIAYQSDTAPEVVARLVESEVLRRTMGRLVLGHRSLCALLADSQSFARTVADLRMRNRPTAASDLVGAFLRAAGSSATWDVLKKLHLQVGFRGAANLSARSQLMVEVWGAIDGLIERIVQQQKDDPTWGANVASALFTVEALCAIGLRDLAQPSMAFIRSQWQLLNGHVEIDQETATRLDFDEIKRAMIDEDGISGVPQPLDCPATSIDASRMHRTWVQGLVLCSEATQQDLPEDRLGPLIDAVEAGQEADGSFYPARVPWVTARVIMGLARCGRSYINSDAVRQACDWLLRPEVDRGPFRHGVWHSGTGSWNTTLETTSMCIMALVSAGVPASHPSVDAALSYVWSSRNEWTRPGRELDGANAILAFLSIRGNWHDIIPQVQYLLRWARGEAFWDRATLSAKQSLDQSSKVAIIADYLIEAAWSNLRVDLPQLLGALAMAPASIAGESALLPRREGSDDQIERLRNEGGSKLLLEYTAERTRLSEEIRRLARYGETITAHGPTQSGIDVVNGRNAELRRDLDRLESRYHSLRRRMEDSTTIESLTATLAEWQRALEAS